MGKINNAETTRGNLILPLVNQASEMGGTEEKGEAEEEKDVGGVAVVATDGDEAVAGQEVEGKGNSLTP